MTTDQTPLRDRIAEAALSAVEVALGDTLVPAAREQALAGIAAVLPATTDQTAEFELRGDTEIRAAALREAASSACSGAVEFNTEAVQAALKNGGSFALIALVQLAVAEHLRRMADETQPAETVPCMRSEPHPAHSHSGLRKGVVVHGRCPGGDPAAGARQDGAQ
ncbi:hypothetical protein [Streptomyces flaveolus]|uniref:hypothetical protein n=1 Tax=Streptomyces flaveolus TaxID=67297 RepID=UPI0016705E20|nr:hypothetical protein [Streptomyces flaveolus]GGQ83558.1 hypothetical protein GCM10010216_51740 [Streptomyces flaveolus]